MARVRNPDKVVDNHVHKTQSVATAVGDLADDIRYLARLAANQLDATT